MDPTIRRLVPLVEQHHHSDNTGHDWWHVRRVWQLAAHIAEREGANPIVVQLAALLHDADDPKFFPSPIGGPRHPNALNMLKSIGANADTIRRIDRIIAEVSFKGAGVSTQPTTLEGCVVQDADRLDAIGAIGIARTLTYGGARGRTLYNPAVEPHLHASHQEYMAAKGTTINHFHEKLLLLADRLNTQTARAIARQRHELLVLFVDRFKAEWDGSDYKE